eukprot:1903070-Lingulodinium_polyedra.AAC.1
MAIGDTMSDASVWRVKGALGPPSTRPNVRLYNCTCASPPILPGRCYGEGHGWSCKAECVDEGGNVEHPEPAI